MDFEENKPNSRFLETVSKLFSEEDNSQGMNTDRSSKEDPIVPKIWIGLPPKVPKPPKSLKINSSENRVVSPKMYS